MSLLKEKEKDSTQSESTQGGQINSLLVFATGVTAVAAFLYGYDTGIISGALLPIKDQFHLQHTMQEIVASAILVGAVCGALTCGWLFERLGRRRTLTLIATVYILGALASSLSPNAITLALSRVFLGFAVGGSSQTGPVYVAEISPAAKRGHFVTSFNVAIGLGILTADIVSLSLHDRISWRWMIGGAVVPATFLLLGTLKIPESPRWLVGIGQKDRAREELASVRGDDSVVDKELKDIEEITAKEQKAPVKGWAGLAQPWVRPAVIAALGIAAFTQLTGIEMMIYYAPTLLANLGFQHTSALKASLGLGIIYAVMTAVGLFIVDRVGRRRLSLSMLPGAALSLCALGCLFAFHLDKKENAWMIVTCLFLFMFFNAGGIQVVGWLSGSEMYPLAVRGAGTSAQAGMVWGSDLLVTATALTLVQLVTTGGVMWIYGAMNILAMLFILRFVPETAGRSLEDIENMLRRKEFHP